MKLLNRYPMLFCLFFGLLLSGAAFSNPPPHDIGADHVYVYGTLNRNYQCTVYLAYFETDGGSVFYADKCVATSSDAGFWPVFPPQPIHVSLDFMSPRFARFEADCQFVAHAQAVNRQTSTVIDCR